MQREPSGEPGRSVHDKWAVPGAGAHYALRRFRDPRARLRDPMLVDRILARYGVRPSLRPVLDAPCGTGRMRAVIERRGLRYVGLDASAEMLGEAATSGADALVRARIELLPFESNAFEAVICCRLLHHLDEREELEPAVAELVRVSHRLVIASFWDAASLHAWRARVGLRRSEGPRGRRAVSKQRLARAFDEAGASVASFHHSFRFVSQQAFVVAVKRAPVDAASKPWRALPVKLFDLDVAPGQVGQA